MSGNEFGARIEEESHGRAATPQMSTWSYAPGVPFGRVPSGSGLRAPGTPEAATSMSQLSSGDIEYEIFKLGDRVMARPLQATC